MLAGIAHPFVLVCPMDKTPIHKEFAAWLAAQMAGRGFNRSDLARLIWGTVPDTRGYDVAKNRDRIGAYLRGSSYPSLDTKYELAKVFDVGWIDDIPGPCKQSRAKPHVVQASPTTLINQKLDRILELLLKRNPR
jgi:transcriptional regulator with XRE-family HTH domain